MYIYLITDDFYFKIGLTNNIDKRIKQLQTGSPNKLRLITSYKLINESNTFKVEKALHNTFKRKRIENEWFDLESIDILKFNDTCIKIESDFIYLNDNKVGFNSDY